MDSSECCKVPKGEIIKRIEKVCLDVLKMIATGQPPVLELPRCSNWNDVVFTESINFDLSHNCSVKRVAFAKAQSVKKFATMLKIMKIIYCLIQENRYCTKRDIYYQHPELYGSQAGMDRVIDDIACMLWVPRWELHIVATCKGLVAGNLQFKDEQGALTDCRQTISGIQIAAHSKDMQNIQTQARFVLIVEKDATFQNLMTSKFCEKMKQSILITGKGFPDIGTRLLLRKLWCQHQLPMFALVDADPHGLEIMAVYKYGSRNQAFESRHLAVPAIQWLGIWPEDIQRYSIPETSLIPLSEGDFKKAQALKKRPYFKHDVDILSQIDLMLQSGKKAEIQCLDAISSLYLCDVYLPSRIQLMLPTQTL
ncbi:meiotic recombination protein SPO11 [Aplysia californica]|uniref:DNA topoisomerase (ATP-hydrolyzing) n=1 Tax=Aplysia californica TaxID=6500 RepID=A0ABM1AFY3_APLCA|nr:meiotic recombination protein SPO11 [Aplysia californica]XP_012946887.1 meiotic recombination protein SPO11 [Aplysia californica]XP_012946889.1 meiotic recombination protein SPO11 [Aplysia californica]XP_012946891.1 meiotic recombination protein SPO11 [Aplysia californica]XP_035829810.1 meiotic recombination protein SPO11 [Aplysia californica]